MLAYIFFALALAVRFMPHVFHFTPVGAAMLFFGANRPKKEWPAALAVALVVDALITTRVYHLAVRWDTFASVLYYLAAMFLGFLLVKKASVLRVAAASISGSCAFFLISNAIAWATLDMYTKDLGGLLHAYVLGLPFFRATLAGDLLYAAAMFGVPAVIASMQRKRALATVRTS